MITKYRQRKTRRNKCVLDRRAMGWVDLCGSLLRLQRVLVLQMNGVKYKHCWRRGDASSHEILLSFLEIGKLDRTPKHHTVQSAILSFHTVHKHSVQMSKGWSWEKYRVRLYKLVLGSNILCSEINVNCWFIQVTSINFHYVPDIIPGTGAAPLQRQTRNLFFWSLQVRGKK